MITKTDKINCYIEGIRMPIQNWSLIINRNELSNGTLRIPLSKLIVAKAFASALIHITYLEGTQEKLLYEGLCSDIVIHDGANILELTIVSKFSIFNFNTTLDYMSPKKYGFAKLDEGIKIWLGNEDVTSVSSSDFGSTSNLSDRYFFTADDVADISPEDPESNKLFYIMNRFPFAERFAFAFWEDIAYPNFLLTRSYVDRLNLLNKNTGIVRKTKAEQVGEQALLQTTDFIITLDPKRTALDYRNDRLIVSKAGCLATDDGTVSGTPLVQSGDFVNFRDLAANDSRAQYIDFRGASPRDEQWCTSATGKAFLEAAQRIYNQFSVKLIVGDISKANSAGTGFIGTGWGPHRDHARGTAADLYIPGASNSTTSDFDFNRCIAVLKIFFSVGANWIAFQYPSRQADLSRLSGGIIKNISGHQSHLHVQM